MLGVRQRCTNRTRDGRISERGSPERCLVAFLIYWWCTSCSNECDLREVSGILNGLLFWIIGVGWAGENAGKMHSKNQVARLLRLWVCCFCFNWCGVHVRSIWLGCCDLGQRRQRRYNSAIAAKLAFFCPDWIWAYLFTLLLCQTDTHLDFMLEYAGQELRKKFFTDVFFLCFELSCHDS